MNTMPSQPVYVVVIFELTVLATILLLNRYIRKSSATGIAKSIVIIFAGQILWLLLQSLLAIGNLYNSNLNLSPPRLLIVGILPPLLFIIYLFTSKFGRKFIDSLPLNDILLLNIVRIPVEIVLLLLFFNRAVPQLMTLEGGNPDILSGITAPVIFYYGFRKGRINRSLLLIWNLICLGLLINIVARALLAAPFPIQMLAFNQPNIAILNFPFNLLPTFIVPVVLFGHLTMIRKLLMHVKEGHLKENNII